MPRLIEPPGMPEEVSAAIETIGNRARAEILHALTTCGPLTTTELGQHVGVRRDSIHHHLLHLETAGLVIGDIPADDRARRRTLRWAINKERVRDVAEAWITYTTGHGD